MPTPEFIVTLREKIGHDPLFLPGVTAIVLKPVPEGAPIWEVPQVLLVKRADNGAWTPVTGIAEPGENPHVTAAREVKEEAGVDAEAVTIIGTGTSGPTTYPNGDVTSYIDICYRMELTGNDEPFVGDEESTDVRWFSVAQLPEMQQRFRLLIADAVVNLRHPDKFRPRLGYEKRSHNQ